MVAVDVPKHGDIWTGICKIDMEAGVWPLIPIMLLGDDGDRSNFTATLMSHRGRRWRLQSTRLQTPVIVGEYLPTITIWQTAGSIRNLDRSKFGRDIKMGGAMP